MTRRQLCQLILRMLSGERNPSADFPVTENEVNLHLNGAIAQAAVQNYRDSIELDGFENVNESFYYTYKNIAITQDDDNFYVAILPQTPSGVFGWDVSDMRLKGSDGVSLPMVRMKSNRAAFRDKLPKENNKLYYSIVGNRVVIDAGEVVLPSGDFSLRATIMTGGAEDLDGVLNMPDNYLPFVLDYMRKILLPEVSVPADNNNTGQNQK